MNVCKYIWVFEKEGKVERKKNMHSFRFQGYFTKHSNKAVKCSIIKTEYPFGPMLREHS